MIASGKKIPTLIGFRIDSKEGKGSVFNFILSNGAQSTLSGDKLPTDYTFMIPKKALSKIRSVNIHCYFHRCISGFAFFDKDGALLWEIGVTTEKEKETVLLDENEVIVGVVAKQLKEDAAAVFTDF